MKKRIVTALLVLSAGALLPATVGTCYNYPDGSFGYDLHSSNGDLLEDVIDWVWCGDDCDD